MLRFAIQSLQCAQFLGGETLQVRNLRAQEANRCRTVLLRACGSLTLAFGVAPGASLPSRASLRSTGHIPGICTFPTDHARTGRS